MKTQAFHDQIKIASVKDSCDVSFCSATYPLNAERKRCEMEREKS